MVGISASRLRAGTPRLLESLESRLLLSGSFDDSHFAGTWGFAGFSHAGEIELDDSQNVSGGSLSDDSGGVVIPSGTYTIDANGLITLDTPLGPYSGAMNSTRDTVIASESGSQDGNIALMVNSGAGTFDNSALDGAWALIGNGESSDSTGSGSITFNGGGTVTAGTMRNTSGVTRFAGTYTVNSDGSLVINITTAQSNAFVFGGRINENKDVVALSADDLHEAKLNDNSRMLVLIKREGTYSNADLNGDWTLVADGTAGAATFDGAGHITGGTLFDDSGKTKSLVGTYAISANGQFTLNILATEDGTDSSELIVLKGSLNASRNLAAAVEPPANTGTKDSGDSLVLLVRSSNRAPTLTKIATTLSQKAIAGLPFALTYDDLKSESNADDYDDDTLEFEIEDVPPGTLTLNGSPVTPGTTRIAAGDALAWTPPAGQAGVLPAFTVKAHDGLAKSASAVAVKIATLRKPTVMVTATKPIASEVTGSTTGFGVITISRSGGDLSQPLTIQYAVGGTAGAGDYTSIAALNGTLVLPSRVRSATFKIAPDDDGTIEGNETLALTLTPDTSYNIAANRSAATIMIRDANRKPTFTTVATLAGATQDTPFDITYETLLAATDATDPEGQPIQFRVQKLVGTLLRNTLPVSGAFTIAAGDTLTWTPPAGATGTLTAFSIAAFDGSNVTLPRKVQITVV